MSKYGGSEKATQALVAAYMSRGSRLAPLKPRRPPASSSSQGGRLPPLFSHGSLASSGPGAMQGWGYWEDSRCWLSQDPRHPHRVAPPSFTTCFPN